MGQQNSAHGQHQQFKRPRHAQQRQQRTQQRPEVSHDRPPRPAAAGKKQALSVVFIDVDNFKHINDTYGHATGDLVLQATARALQSCVRGDGDWAARFGGDEFVACLGDADSAAARRIAERIREAVSAASVPFGGETIRFTVSLGIQTMNGSERSAEEMLQAADRNMYSSKQSGKNRVTDSKN